MENNNIFQLETQIVKILKNIYDPEIPVNVYDLGLIYNVDIDDDSKVKIKMTLTAPNCPMADELLAEVHEKIKNLEGVKDVDVILVFDPPWNKDMMSEEAMLELGFM
ncbi:MAG TPA: SUF system Fe-S cluster assembly protein [Bacteroidales bacterium]|nr:SUF system Fe-S cluster assembly protein [Bacteroidales bacterium]